jgi:hypothetical protein
MLFALQRSDRRFGTLGTADNQTGHNGPSAGHHPAEAEDCQSKTAEKIGPVIDPPRCRAREGTAAAVASRFDTVAKMRLV